MKARTFPQQIGCIAHGPVEIRAALIVETDDGAEISRQWHRFTIAPDMTPAEVSLILSANNNNIEKMGFPPIDETGEDWQRVLSVAATSWTPSVRTQFATVKAAYLAQLQADADATAAIIAERNAEANANAESVITTRDSENSA